MVDPLDFTPASSWKLAMKSWWTCGLGQKEASVFKLPLDCCTQSTVSEEQKMKSVAEAIDLLELDDIADR